MNYVKFMRGTPQAFTALKTKDNDTLYFIAEKDTSSGRLYLGDKEIVCDANQNSVLYLRDLLDVALPDNVSELLDGQVLTYDVASESWVARDPATIVSAKFDGNQFVTNDLGELSLINFDNAPSGAYLSKSSDGDLVWQLIEFVSAEVVDQKIAEAVAALNHLSYKIVENIEQIDLTAKDADKFIYLVSNGDKYDEYMVIDKKLERIGDWNISLDNYATKEEVVEINTKVVDLSSQLNTAKAEINDNQTKIAAIETTVNNLSTQLTAVSSDVVNLATALNTVQQRVNNYDEKISTLETVLANKVNISTYNEKMQIVDTDIAELKAAITWNDLSETL